MKKLYLSLVLIAVPVLFMFGCGDTLDDLTSQDISANIDLGSFTLTESGGAGLTLTTPESGNPSCGDANLNELLDQVPELSEHLSKIDSIQLQNVKYRIPVNNTPGTVSGSLQMTNPSGGGLAEVGSVSISSTVDTFTTLPFASGGQAILQHYLDNRNSTFDYCAEGSPDSGLSMTIEIQAGVVVTVDLL